MAIGIDPTGAIGWAWAGAEFDPTGEVVTLMHEGGFGKDDDGLVDELADGLAEAEERIALLEKAVSDLAVALAAALAHFPKEEDPKPSFDRIAPLTPRMGLNSLR